MIKRSLIRGLSKLSFRFSTSPLGSIEYIQGKQELVENTLDVQLRGIKLTGYRQDLPNMIFFPDLFDTAENWVPFFRKSTNSILNHRNVYIVYPRNFGTSDSCMDNNEDHGEAVAMDVERFMYDQKITMATLAGHGFGAKNAMVTGCYRPELVTGVLALDYAPQDYTYFRVGHTYREIVNKLGKINLDNISQEEFAEQLDEIVQCKKIQSTLLQNLKMVGSRKFRYNFNLNAIQNRFDDYVNWKMKYGIFGGRTCFLFPEYSNYVFLNQNTVGILKVCVQNNGFLRDIFTLKCDENDNPETNHWIYENKMLADQANFKSTVFLQNYDGVHVQLANRIEVAEKYPIPCIKAENSQFYNGLRAPTHLHHNWRFSDVYNVK
jgi:pimeloyl-ACP methyl ester carboxylesterase